MTTNAKTGGRAKCHFTPMESCSSDYETWLECRHCGHTIPISEETGER